MTFKKWAWEIFETTGNPEAFLAIKEAEKQEKNMSIGLTEFGNIEVDANKLTNKEKNETHLDGDINGANKN